jgi:formylglycine-generating enzyme required for sulfatase activity
MMYHRLVILGFLFVLLTSCQNKEIKIAMGSIESDPQNFYQLPKEFQVKPEIALLAVEKSAKIFKDLDIFLKEDEAFVLEAIDRNFRVYAELSNRLKKNVDILGKYQKKKMETRKMYGMEMVFMKGGSFMMGSEDKEHAEDYEKPVHSVNVKDFYMSKTEVTVGQYRKCVEAGVCSEPHWDDGSCNVYDGSDWEQGVLGKEFRGENQPIVCGLESS